MEFEQQPSRPPLEPGTGKQRQLESIIELAGVLSRQTDFQEMLRFVTSQASAILNAKSAAVMMINPRTQETVKTIISEGDKGEDKRAHIVRTNVTGWVLKHNKSFLSADIRDDPRLRKNLFGQTAVHSVMCGPLVSEGVTIGCLLVMNGRVDQEFTVEDLSLLGRSTKGLALSAKASNSSIC
jgi:GAF domain-containing protein